MARGKGRRQAILAVVARVAVEGFHAVDERGIGGKLSGPERVRLVEHPAFLPGQAVKIVQTVFARVVRQGKDILFLQAIDQILLAVALKADFQARQDDHAQGFARPARGAVAGQKGLPRGPRSAASGQVMVGNHRGAIAGRMQRRDQLRRRQLGAGAGFAGVRMNLQKDALAHIGISFGGFPIPWLI